MLGIALSDEGTVLAESLAPSPDAEGSPSDLLDALCDLHESLTGDLASSGRLPPVALGIGAPGLVDDDGVLLVAPNLKSGNGAALAAGVSQRVGVPVVVDNDATCAALAEVTMGAAIGVADVVVVNLGTGIGGGLVNGGAVMRGAHGFAGEVGHMVVDPDGAPCVCGGRGCWERFASASGLARLAREAGAAGRLDAALSLAGGDLEALRPEHVTTAAAAGDGDALALLDRLGWWVALGVWNLTLALDPGLVVLGGGLVSAWPSLLDAVRRYHQEFGRPWQRPSGITPIVAAGLGGRSGAVGAALVARHGHRNRSSPAGLGPGSGGSSPCA